MNIHWIPLANFEDPAAVLKVQQSKTSAAAAISSSNSPTCLASTTPLTVARLTGGKSGSRGVDSIHRCASIRRRIDQRNPREEARRPPPRQRTKTNKRDSRRSHSRLRTTSRRGKGGVRQACTCSISKDKSNLSVKRVTSVRKIQRGLMV